VCSRFCGMRFETAGENSKRPSVRRVILVPVAPSRLDGTM